MRWLLVILPDILVMFLLHIEQNKQHRVRMLLSMERDQQPKNTKSMDEQSIPYTNIF